MTLIYYCKSILPCYVVLCLVVITDSWEEKSSCK